MKPEEYWARRMEDLNESQLKKGEDYIKAQNAEYDKAMTRIKKETEAWYARLAKNNDISMAEARKLLTANELREFHWDVQEYIKRGRENAVDQRWVKQLENASAKVHITRLEELETKLRQEVELLSAKRLKGTTNVMGNIYKDGYYKGIHEVQRGVGEGLPFAKLDTKQLDKVLAKPWTPNGVNFSTLIWRDRDKLFAELQTILTQDLIRGENADKVIADFAKRMGVTKSNAERLILTESAYFSGQSRLDGYKETGVTHYKYVATLDHRTSKVCKDWDGEIIPLSEARAGVNYPPLHAYCRSTTIPHFDDSQEVGERAARSEEDGKTYQVPGDMTYKDWAEKHAPPDVTKPPKPDEPKVIEPSKVKTAEPVPEPLEPKEPPKSTAPRIDPPKSAQSLLDEPKLTHDEEAAVMRYIGGESYSLNDKLRRGIPLDPPEMDWVEQLDRALDNLPKYHGDLTRSLHFPNATATAAFMDDVKPEAVLQYPQYISTTAGELYNPESQVIFYILNAALGADMRKLNPGEMEVLYGRNFPFKVIKVEHLSGVYHVLLREWAR